jgi:cyanate permease
MIILMKVVGRPGWWVLLCFLPLINFVIFILVAIDLAKVFGKSAAFAVVMLLLLSPIGFLIIGFGSARYLGPAAPGA